MTNDYLRAGGLLAVALLAVLALAGSGLGVVAAGPVLDAPDEQAPGDETAQSGEIDPALDSSSGTVQVLVTLNSSAQPEMTMTPAEDVSPLEQPIRNFAADRSGVTVQRSFWIADTVLLEVDQDDVDLQQLAAVRHVEYVDENSEVEPFESPAVTAGQTSDTSSPAGPELPATQAEPDADADGNVTYGLDQINAPEVWDQLNNRGEGTKIAVLDTGVDVSHQDIDLFTTDPDDPTYPGGWAEFDGQGNQIDSEPYDAQGHGTHVSGTVAGGDESGVHIGVAPEADLIHGGVLTPQGGTEAAVIAGMQWAVEQDADVISMSLGAPGYQPGMINAVRSAEQAGTVVVAAIGNSGQGTSGSPGNIYETLSVGAADEGGNIAGFSGGEQITTDVAWGDAAPDNWPDEYIVPTVSGPGVQVLSSIPGNDYAYFDGTSMATPHVSGTIALMLSESDRTVSETKEHLETTAWKPDDAPEQKDIRYGEGIIDAYEATTLEGDGVAVSLPDDAAGPGESVTASLTTEATNVAGYHATVYFDPDVVQVTDVAAGDIGEPTVNIDNEAGSVELTVADANGTDKPVLADIEFTVLEDAANGAQSSLMIGAGTELVTPSGEPIPTISDDGSIVVSQDPVRLSLSSATASAGETVTSTLDSEAAGLAGYDATVTFDPDVVRFESVSGVDMADPGVNVDNDEGTVRLTAAQATDAESPTLANLTFKVIGDEGETSPLAFDTKETVVVNATGDELLTAYEPGEVAVDAPGDEASFVVSDLDPVETTVEVGAEVDVSAVVSNVGGAEGTQDVDLRLDGNTVVNQSVTLGPGEETPVEFTITADEPGEYTHGVFTLDDSATGTLVVEEQLTGATAHLVPEQAEAPVDGTTTLELELRGVEEGVGAYQGEIQIANTDIAEITGMTPNGEPIDTNIDISYDGSSVSFEVAQGGDVLPPGNVTLAEITISGAAEGTTSMSYASITAGDAAGTPFEIVRTEGADIQVEETACPAEPVAGDNPPQDQDGDGLCEDINGDGQLDIFDVQALFANLDNDVVQDNSEVFNFAGADPNEVTVFDVQALFEMAT